MDNIRKTRILFGVDPHTRFQLLVFRFDIEFCSAKPLESVASVIFPRTLNKYKMFRIINKRSNKSIFNLTTHQKSYQFLMRARSERGAEGDEAD